MSDQKGKGRYEIEPGVYVLDSSGTASEGRKMKRLADAAAKRVKENFDPSKLRPLNEDRGEQDK